MFSRLITAAFHRPAVVILTTVLCTLLGIAGYRGLPTDVFPDLSAPVFNVITQNSAMAPEELEARVVIPMELALRGLDGVGLVLTRGGRTTLLRRRVTGAARLRECERGEASGAEDETQRR